MSSSTPAASASTSTGIRPTPVRAIPSTLAIKSAPTIPLPTDSYEPLVKTVLRHRLAYNIFLQSSLLTWASVTTAIIWQKNAASMSFAHLLMVPFNPLTIVASLVVWVFMALPVVVLRKNLLIPTRSTATSPANSLSSSVTKPGVRRAFLVYITSALMLVVVHTIISYVVEPTDPKLRLFVKSKKHPNYLNGRLIFIIISQIAIAISYGVRNVMLDRFAFKWGIATQKNDSSLNITLLDVVRSFIVSSVLSLVALPITATIFAVARFFLPILYRIPFVSLFLRPFTAHFLRGSWTIFLPLRHVDLIRRALHLGFISFFIWDIVDTLFDSNVAKQISIANLTANPNQTLISGISSKDAIFKYFAYSELCTLTEDKSPAAVAQRTALFADQKYTPTLWSRFIRESLLLLGHDYQLFLRRGSPTPPPPPPSTTTTTPTPTPVVNASSTIASSPVTILRKRIFKNASEDVIETTLDALSSDGPVSRAVNTNVKATVEIPEIFRSAEIKVAPPTKQEVPAESAMKKSGGGSGVMGTIQRRIKQSLGGVSRRYVPPIVIEYLGSWDRWWRNDRMSKSVEKSLPLRELDVVVIEVISRLTCASLTEDRYGVVQRDIPRILEAFLSFLSAIEEYQVQVNSLYVPSSRLDGVQRDGGGNGEGDGVTEDSQNVTLTPKELEERERLRYEVEKSGEVLGAIADGLKEGVARIVRTFGDKLLAFKFPPRTAQKLQGFLDYC